MTLDLLPEILAVCRLAADEAIPAWSHTSPAFLSITRTPDELSIVAMQSSVPTGAQAERDYRAFKVRGPLAPTLVGVLLSILAPLAAAGVSIVAVSTYDTDYVLVKSPLLDRAIRALRDAGHEVVD